MASHFLTPSSSMSCPHGGTVTASTRNTKVRVDREFVLRSTDTFTIGGCTYTIGQVPHPCVSVRWDVHAERHESDGDPSLTEDSVGWCLAGDQAAQGQVSISSTQSRAAGL